MGGKFIEGSISWGTLRTYDLISAFSGELERLDPEKYYEVMTDDGADIIPEDAQGNDRHPYWDSEDASYLLEDLFESLSELAPEGYFFGSTEGDGSDFGFWERCSD